MASSASGDPSSPGHGKAVVFLKASKGNDDPYAVVRHADQPINVHYSCRIHSMCHPLFVMNQVVETR